MSYFLKKKPEIRHPTNYYSPTAFESNLIYALENHHPAMAMILLEDIRPSNGLYWINIFGAACKGGCMQIATNLLGRVSDKELDTYGAGYFRVAIENGHFDTAKWLYELSCSRKKTYYIYPGSFVIACKRNYTVMAQWMLKIYDNTGTPITQSDFSSSFNVHDGRNDHSEIYQVLFEYGMKNDYSFDDIGVQCSFNPSSTNVLAYIKLAEKYGKPLNITSLFPSACSTGGLELVKHLVDIGEKSNKRINIHLNNELPFNTAIKGCHYDIADYLIFLSENGYGEFNINYLL